MYLAADVNKFEGITKVTKHCSRQFSIRVITKSTHQPVLRHISTIQDETYNLAMEGVLWKWTNYWTGRSIGYSIIVFFYDNSNVCAVTYSSYRPIYFYVVAMASNLDRQTSIDS